MNDVAIRVEDLGKRYRLGARQKTYRDLREHLVETVKLPFRRLRSAFTGGSTILSDESIWALQDVTFDVEEGEVVGVIGRNGAGKTTLLKVLSRITEPTEGRAEIHGRVASLLEVGTGFHPELTGRENVYLNGAILGMRRTEIDRKFDEIVAFAEVERFLDTQVKHYSSGMYLRLAFAVAAHLEPEILLVDEVLAVGDASFQRRCLGKMSDVARSGRTVVFVSHNMEAVQRLCSRTVWLEGGRAVADGPTEEVVAAYLHEATEEVAAEYRADPATGGDDPVRLLEARLVGEDGAALRQVRVGEPFTVWMRWEHRVPVPGGYYFIRVWDEKGRFLFGVNYDAPSAELRGSHEISCSVRQNVLGPGRYRLSIGCYRPPSTTLHVVEDCLGLTVREISFQEHGSGFSPNSLFVPQVRWEAASTVTVEHS